MDKSEIIEKDSCAKIFYLQNAVARGGKNFLIQLKTKLPLKWSVQRVFLFLLLMCGFCFLLINHLSEKYFKTSIEVRDIYINNGLILDTPGCRIPKLDPFDKTVKHLIVRKKPYICKGMQTFFILKPNATISVNETVLKNAYNITLGEVKCFYKAIYREPEPKGGTRETAVSLGKRKVLKFDVSLEEEFLKVECELGKENLTQFVPLVSIKPEAEKNKIRTADKDTLNVVLIGIDSVSKLNFLRHFKKTHDFLKLNLSAFDMKGYTKVGDNTFPNLTPMLTGHFIEHYWNESIRNTFFFDGLDFIWKKYSSRGYRTFYAEDSPYFGTFQYNKRGFKDPPTDYYFRPIALKISDSELRKKGKYYCLNDQLEMEILYKYLRNFLETMENRPNFSFTMVSSLTHDSMNDAAYADEPTYNLLQDLYAKGTMNNSLVVVFSDHGLRFGPIRETYLGKFEERMPIMYLSFPKWFLDENSQFAKNLKINQKRLVTLFDLHATLYHLLNISEVEKPDPTPNGLSLMGEISEYRTCEMTKILPHWCPCQVYQYLNPKDESVKNIAAVIIDRINSELKRVNDKCARLEIDKITDARLGQANDMVLRFVKHQHDVLDRQVVYGDKGNILADFLITLKAFPGGGIFEGTVRVDSKHKTMDVLYISRINRYGEQSKCIDLQSLQKFCFCK